MQDRSEEPQDLTLEQSLEEAMKQLDKIAEIQRKAVIFHQNINSWNKEAWNRNEQCQSKIKACTSQLLGPVNQMIKEGTCAKLELDTLAKKH